MRWTGCLARMKWISRYDFQSRITEVLTTSRRHLMSLFLSSIVLVYLSSSSFVQPPLSCWSIATHQVRSRVVAVVAPQLLQRLVQGLLVEGCGGSVMTLSGQNLAKTPQPLGVNL